MYIHIYWAGEMAECARLGTILSAAQRHAFKFSLRPKFENLLQLLLQLIFGAYKSADIVLRVCLLSCVCLTRLTLLTFVYCSFDMIQ